MSRALDFDTVVEHAMGLGRLAEVERACETRCASRRFTPATAYVDEYAPRVAHEIKAHITGTVWKIEAAVGQRIEEDDVVVILESMKMEMPLESTEAGVVSRVCVSEGDAVEEGDVLVVLD